MNLQGNSYQDFCPKAYEKELKEAKEYYGYALKHGYMHDETLTDDEIIAYWRKAL